ncbi:rab11 family-interacting protein 2 [Brienomyrus brachyistius]|uniref:rab11 family-interacting protein 2 n=1 Tax=Brienomyrus brachyistius TaxID=42636 RepID=UPI0020B2467A|nr:rab11 family-interacting protein 2 [Brienomyrus brachyistius]
MKIGKMTLAKESQKWFPSHVQVTVIQAKDLQAKGRNGTNDAYTIIQLGKEKYCTSVSEKTLNPVWREEASFELPGQLLEENPEIHELTLIAMHRSLVGIDKFLGLKTINLNEIFVSKERRKTDWFSLESRPGKKWKNRGQIQISIQFVRNNLTASMFDLSMKEKTRSPFSKFKDKMKGRKHDGLFSDASSAIISRSSFCEVGSHSSTGNHQLKPKKKRSQLLGPQKLSAAHSMSDLMHFQPKVDPTKKTENRDITDDVSQKYATMPRSHNPFEGERSVIWDNPDWKEKKDKVSLLEWVTGKKDDGQSCSSGDLRCSNPFSNDAQGDSNPFIQHYKLSGNLKQRKNKEDITSGQKPSLLEEENHDKNNDTIKVHGDLYQNLSFDEVVKELIKHKEVVKKKDAHIRELEDYIDDLLVRVMEETPSILRNPYEPTKKAEKRS